MKKIFLAAAILSLSTINFQLSAQTSDPVVLEVGGKAIRQSEFMKDFMNTVGNSLNAKPDITAADKRRELDEYVELYANFRAKDLDARSLGMDTEEGLQKELSRYRTELAAPYLIDSAVAQRILRNAYEHNRYTLHAAHILVQVRPGASPADTLEAYQRAMGYRERALKGEDFFALSSEEVHRVQPDAPKNEYEGELNCFTAFDMVYPFEEGAYALKEGEISMPVRSRFGYHIIKLIDKMELYGRLTLQHIWVSNKNDELGINEMYNRLQEGVPFEMVARQSDDMSTSDKGGYIVDAMPSQLPHEYVKVLAGLKEGEYSAPFLTRYGWHIVRLVKKEQMPTFEELVPLYRQRLSRDPRGEMSKKSFAVTARKKYNMVDYTQMKQASGKRKGKKKQPVKMMASLDELVSIINDSVFRGQWRYDESALTDLRPLAKLKDKEYNALDVARYIHSHQKREGKVEASYYVRERYNDFLDSVAVAYADSQLENEYPDFAGIIDEYRRGLMIFNYNEKMIWRKAVDDSVGFAQFYERESQKKRLDNPDDSLFFWQSRARVVITEVENRNCLDAEKAVKMVKKALKKDMGTTEMREMLTEKVDANKCNSREPVHIYVDLIEQNHQTLLTDEQWKPGVYTTPVAFGYRIVAVQSILPPTLKAQMEARGYYLSAWQNEVERQLIADLRAKYNVKIHKDVVDKITY